MGHADNILFLKTLQQYVVANKSNETLLEMARTMMAQANLPISFWDNALLIVACILITVPSQSIPFPPFMGYKKAKSSFWSICACAAQEVMITIPCISARNYAGDLESVSLQGILIVRKAMLHMVNTWV